MGANFIEKTIIIIIIWFRMKKNLRAFYETASDVKIAYDFTEIIRIGLPL